MVDRLTRSLGRNPRLQRDDSITILTPPPALPINALPEGGLYQAAMRANAAVLKASVLAALAQQRTPADILWVGFDLPAGAALAGGLGEGACAYHCFDEVRGWPYLARHGPALERRLASKAHVLFATSRALVRAKADLGVPIEYLPNGVDHRLFASALASPTGPPPVMRNLPPPVLGCVGNFDERVDFRLLEQVAWKFAAGTLVLIGPAEGSSRERLRILETLPNVRYLGPVDQRDLPGYLHALDIGLIPYRKTLATRHIYPLKANEYLAAGKPVIATDFADLSDLSPPVRVAAGVDAFFAAIATALQDATAQAARDRSRYAAQNS
ncbi:MAG: glycosyltransferase, partial [Cyanobacteria bacterium REEB65]|nr:glycosyltransferase [Cyanobacteria bacterium REEB65]